MVKELTEKQVTLSVKTVALTLVFIASLFPATLGIGAMMASQSKDIKDTSNRLELHEKEQREARKEQAKINKSLSEAVIVIKEDLKHIRESIKRIENKK